MLSAVYYTLFGKMTAPCVRLPLLSHDVCSLALELGIFVSQGIWLVRTRKLRKQAKLAGMEFDDLPEARQYQASPSGGRASSKPGADEVGMGLAAEPFQKD